jgi:transcription elongation factor GreA
MTNKTFLTQSGFEQLKQELADLKQKEEHLITQIEEVAQPDESGEDSLATQLKEELELVTGKIEQLNDALEMSQIINGNAPKNGAVQIGSKVKIKISGKKELEFNIVNHIEADPTQNKISDQSPLGQALMGHKINDEVDIEAPIGRLTYKIVAIN